MRGQGTLTEGEGSVQSTSSIRELVLEQRHVIFSGATTLSITTLSKMAFSIKTFSIRYLHVTLSMSDSQHKRHSV